MTRATLVLCLLAIGNATAFEAALDPRTIEQALGIGLSGLAATRTDYHKPYRIHVGRPPIDYVDIVTPFRRVVIAAEARRRAGERLFGQREALEALGASPQRVDVVIEMTFHPLNTFVGIPPYDVVLLGGNGRDLRPSDVTRVPRFGPRVTGVPLPSPTQGVGIAPLGSQPLLGGSIVAGFDGQTLDPRGTYQIGVMDGGTEVGRARVDFNALR